MASDIDQSQATHTPLEDRRKQVEENKEKRNKAKYKAPNAQKIENNKGKNEKEYDTISEEEIEELKSKCISLRMPDFNKLLPEDHVINVYTNYTTEAIDAYYEYNVMNCLWLISAIVKRKCYVHMKEGKIYPNIWVTNLGRSTVSGKTVSMNKAKSFYEILFVEKLSNDDFSVEGYLNLLRKKPDADQMRDEVAGLFANFKKSYNEGIFDKECQIYDYQDVSKILKDEENSIYVTNPCTTKLYGTTPTNFAKYIDVEITESGYVYRFLYSYPCYKRPIKDTELYSEEEDKEFYVVLDRLTEIRNIMDEISDKDESEWIKFDFDPEALKYFNKKNREITTKFDNENNEKMLSLWGRYKIYSIKLAMLIEFGYKEPNYRISLETMKLSIKLMEDYFIPIFRSLLDIICGDTKNNNIEKVISELKNSNGILSKKELLRRTKLSIGNFNDVIVTLETSDEIEIKKNEKIKDLMIILKTDEDRQNESEEKISEYKEKIINKLKSKGNKIQWSDLKNNVHMSSTLFNSIIDSLKKDGKIEVIQDNINTDKPRKIISIKN